MKTVSATRSSRKTLLKGASFLVTGAIVATLTGCFMHGGRYPVSLSLSAEGSLEMAVCKDIRVREFYVSQRIDGKWNRVWEGEGDTFIANGTVLSFGSDIPGLTITSFIGPDLNDESEISVTFLGGEGTGSVAGYFPLHDYKAQARDAWFYTDGTTELESCDLDQR